MRFWFDCEFYEDGREIHLISIGIVAEDNRTYYAEVPSAQTWCNQSEWLRKNVKPLLQGNSTRPLWDVADDLIKFFGEKPEIWAYYGAYDWVALCQLYGAMIELPENFPKWHRDVKQLCWSMGNPQLPMQLTPEHHALNDALWTKQAWEYLMNRQRFVGWDLAKEESFNA